MELAKKALRVSPDCADAYVILAEETASDIGAACELYAKGVEAGEKTLGSKAFKNDLGHFWGILETRPYMRARAGLAHCLWEAGKQYKTMSIEHFFEMLSLNPNDNQGIRYILLSCLLEEGLDDAVGALLDQYPDDCAAHWLYARALWTFRREGRSAKAKKCLKESLEANPFVADYLLGRKKMPECLPEYMGFGDQSEAVVYADADRENWTKTPGALQWFMENLPEKAS